VERTVEAAIRAARVEVTAARKVATHPAADTTAVAVPQVGTAAVAAVAAVGVSLVEGILQEEEPHTLPVAVVNEISGPRFARARAVSSSSALS